MNRLFVHRPLFRILSPIFSGSIVYLLILLINNNVAQLEAEFFGEELYVCIGLSFLIQELSRGLLVGFNKLPENLSFLAGLLIQVLSSLVLCVLVVTITIQLYYKKVVGFSPNREELLLFNGIFCTFTLIYILLHISYQYLYKVNSVELEKELLQKQLVEEDFIQFKEGIHPALLFYSFEALIVLIRQQQGQVDELINHIAATYRYLLAQRTQQLVDIEEEVSVLNQLIKLINYLPYRNILLQNTLQSPFLLVPGSLLKLIERIMRSTIPAAEIPLIITLLETSECLEIQYHHNDTIDQSFNIKTIADLQHVYRIYSLKAINVTENEVIRTISLPKLQINNL